MTSTAADAQTASAAEDIQYPNLSGEPQIPWKVMHVLLAPNVKLDSVVANMQATYELAPDTWTLPPTPPMGTLDKDGKQIIVWPEGKIIVDGCDIGIYETDDFWPEAKARILGTGKLRGWKMAEIAIPLERYNPVSGQLLQLTDAEIVIDSQRGKKETADKVHGKSRVKKKAVNFATASKDYLKAAGSEKNTKKDSGEILTADAPLAAPTLTNDGYVIITTSNIQGASTKLNDFVAHKQSLGFTVTVVTEAAAADATHYVSGTTCDERAGNIRDWLTSHYLTDEILYVLLIGDPHPTTFTADRSIPMKMCISDHPTDYFFAELTCDWDLDGDGIFGETGTDLGHEVEKYFEVYTGRIPNYGVISNLDSILQKTIDYENESDTLWRHNVLLSMVPLDASTQAYELGEQIKQYQTEPAGIPSVRIYDKDYGVNPPPEYLRANRYPATEWAQGIYGLHIWCTHGNTTLASGIIVTGDTPNLNNNYPTAVWQGSCLTGHPETTSNLGYSVLKNGGIGTAAASRNGWYYVGQTSYINTSSQSGMGYQYSKRLVEQNSLGYALYDTKETLGLWLKNWYVMNLYGDPSVVVLPTLPKMTVSPTDKYYITGVAGLSYSMSSRTYTLTNNDSLSLDWTAQKAADWLDLSVASGTLLAGATVDVEVSLNALADELPPGTYTDTVIFTDSTNGVIFERPVEVVIDTKKLSAYWRLDETTGTTAYDASGNGHDGTLEGGLTFDANSISGQFGGALNFTAADPLPTIGIADVSDVSVPWTASMWVKRTGSASSAVLLNSSAVSLRLQQWNNTGRVGVTRYGVGDYTFNYSTPLDTWVHLTFVGTDSGTTLYVNGNYQDTMGQVISCPMSKIGGGALK
ncbi:MAG: LamG-like jellyroll fold domain-containing protein, partial [Desulfobacterales bacterium]